MASGSVSPFTRLGTLGIEEEFYVVDETGRPTSGTDTLVHESDPPAVLEDRLDHELFKTVIEIQTRLIEEPDQARDALLEVRNALVEHAREHGFRIAGAGLHPLAEWRELEHADKPRYKAQLDRIQYPQHRNTTAGVHVHVGVDDGEKAMWIANQLRWYLPIMLALSANSPYWNGFDTGLASARGKTFEALPNTGMPTHFDSLEAYCDFEQRMLETDSINDRGELWYDVRPHTEYGTIEVRAPDGQADPDRTMAFVEYVHALVLDLAERYEDGESGSRLRREMLDENKWRAIRYGHDASFITRHGEETVGLGEVVDRECSRLGVSGIGRIYESGSGTARQRRLREAEGPEQLCESLVLELH